MNYYGQWTRNYTIRGMYLDNLCSEFVFLSQPDNQQIGENQRQSPTHFFSRKRCTFPYHDK